MVCNEVVTQVLIIFLKNNDKKYITIENKLLKDYFILD